MHYIIIIIISAHTSQPLLMPYRVLLDLTSQMMAVDVVDDGALIQRIPWTRGSTYGCIFHQYTLFKAYYRDAIVVFDGYASTNTKDMTHQRLSKGNAGTNVTFTADKPVTMKKEQFLANRQNKQRFMFMQSEELFKEE